MTESQSQAGALNVNYVARLARLELSAEEISTFDKQLQQIVSYVQKIDELDLTGIEPTSHAHPVTNVLRDDVIRPSLAHDDVMQNAPSHRDGQFTVPKIVD